MTTKTHPFAGARKMKPTLRHRLAVWECMLGTVYAANASGEWEYFDYDWDAARAYAGVSPDGDPRVWKSDRRYGTDGKGCVGPSRGQAALWILR